MRKLRSFVTTVPSSSHQPDAAGEIYLAIARELDAEWLSVSRWQMISLWPGAGRMAICVAGRSA